MKNNLKNLRIDKGLNQQDVATLLNITQSCYGSWEKGRTEPSAEMLIKLADIFECSVDYLLGRANELNVVNIQTDLTEQQKELLTNFAKLNVVGKARLLGYTEALLDRNECVRK